MGKGPMYFSIIACSTIGSYIPVLWHAGFFSMSSILGGLLGAFAGVWVGLRLNDYFGG